MSMLTGAEAKAEPSAGHRVLVVGAGFTGLLAARRLAQQGWQVTVVDASPTAGGQVRTRKLAGQPIDVGSEATHLMFPQVGALVDELGLRDSMVTARRGTSWLLTPRGLRPLPEGVGPAGPTRLEPVLRSRVMTVPGLVRAGLEPLVATSPHGRLPEGEDISVGAFVASRFGTEVADRFVDPLLGSLHGGDVRRLSLRACAPSLVPAASTGTPLLQISRSLHRAGGSRRTAGARGAAASRRPEPVVSFVTWPQGMTALVDAMLADLARLRVDVRLGTRATGLTRSADGRGAYEVTLDGPGAAGATPPADAVVLAVPARVAATLLSPLVHAAAETLEETTNASVATVVLGLPPEPVRRCSALRANGLLVPSQVGSLLKAATFLSTKWAHLVPRNPADLFWLRISAGRSGSTWVDELDDAGLVDHLRRDLRAFTGLDVHPEVTHVERWPHAMPQLTVGHRDRLASIRTALAAQAPGIGVAGASYDGIGLASCITSAEQAVARLSDALAVPQPSQHPDPD